MKKKKVKKRNSIQPTDKEIEQLFDPNLAESLPNIISNIDVNENHDSSEEIIIKDEIQVSIDQTLRILMNLFSNKHELLTDCLIFQILSSVAFFG